MNNAVDNWQTILTEIANRTFSGEEKHVKFLTEVITKGKLLAAGVNSREEIKKRNIRTLYAFIIPVIWSLDNPGPVVIDVGTSCDDVGVGNYKWVTPKDAEATSACVDNKQYYLLRTTGVSHNLPSNPNYPVTINKFKPPPGLDKLKTRGGFTVEEIVRG